MQGCTDPSSEAETRSSLVSQGDVQPGRLSASSNIAGLQPKRDSGREGPKPSERKGVKDRGAEASFRKNPVGHSRI